MNESKNRVYYSSPKTEIEPLLPDSLGAVLEIGCGTGATMSWIRRIRPLDYCVGVELVPEIASEAKSVFDEVICGNIETMQLRLNRRMDAILALDVLEHLADPWRIVRILAGHLRPGGLFLASIPNAAHWNLAGPLFLKGQWEYQHDGILDNTHLRFFTEATARRLFEENRFTIEKIGYVKSYPGKTPARRWHTQKYLRHFIPDRFVNFQFLLRARKDVENPAGGSAD